MIETKILISPKKSFLWILDKNSNPKHLQFVLDANFIALKFEQNLLTL